REAAEVLVTAASRPVKGHGTRGKGKGKRQKEMPRRREVPKREVPLDPLYSSALVTKFISTLMRDGKRSTAEQIMYSSLASIQEKTGDDPLKVFKKAVENVKAALEVKSRRVGGSNYQVPVEVNPNRRLSLSIRW